MRTLLQTNLRLLTLVKARRTPAPPQLERPELDLRGLVRPSTNPNRQRVGVSGEVPRTGGKR